MKKIEILQGHTYIFKELYTNYPSIRKGKVLEITDTTYYIHWEENVKYRHLKTTFKMEAIEDMGTVGLETVDIPIVDYIGLLKHNSQQLTDIEFKALDETYLRLLKSKPTLPNRDGK